MKLSFRHATLALTLFGLQAFAQQSSIQDSVITVQELLKIDNQQALEKTTADAVKAGLIKPKKAAGSNEKIDVPLPKWTVLAVYGKQGNLLADLQVDNILAPASRPGAVVAMCKVVAIEDKCVTLQPTGQKVRKGSCSKSCWTGEELSEQLRPAQHLAVGGSSNQRVGAVLPAPLPPAAMPLPTPKAKNQ